MDKRAEQIINSINQQAIDRFKTTTKVVKNKNIERAKEVLNTKSVPDNVKKDVQRLLDRGSFGKNKVITDKNKTKEIKQFIDTKMDSALRSGKLPQPDTREYSNFIKKMNS